MHFSMSWPSMVTRWSTVTSRSTGPVLTASTWTGRNDGSRPGVKYSPGNFSRGAVSCSKRTTTVFGWTVTMRSSGCGSPVSFMPSAGSSTRPVSGSPRAVGGCRSETTTRPNSEVHNLPTTYAPFTMYPVSRSCISTPVTGRRESVLCCGTEHHVQSLGQLSAAAGMLCCVVAAKSPFGRLVLMSGPESLLADRAVASLLKSMRSESPDVEISEIEAAGLDRGKLAEITSPSLFSSRRAAVINDLENLAPELDVELVNLAAAQIPDLALIVVHRGVQKGSGQKGSGQKGR